MDHGYIISLCIREGNNMDIYLVIKTNYKNVDKLEKELKNNSNIFEVDRLLVNQYDELLKPYHVEKREAICK